MNNWVYVNQYVKKCTNIISNGYISVRLNKLVKKQNNGCRFILYMHRTQ